MIKLLNPESLERNPAFAQGTLATGSRTIHVGGQNGIDRAGVMASGAPAQTAQALRNVLAVLNEGGADQTDVAKLTVHLVESVDPREAFGAVAGVWGPHPTAVTVLRVAGLARPDALVEIDAIAVVD
jgi:enamine deaminase RidA (YjgF/YER057c/UK114 family)